MSQRLQRRCKEIDIESANSELEVRNVYGENKTHSKFLRVDRVHLLAKMDSRAKGARMVSGLIMVWRPLPV